MRKSTLWFSFAFIFFCLPSFGKTFRNSYVSFDLPDRWACIPEETETVCRAQTGNESKEAIIILTAKEAGPSDSLQMYEAHLKVPKSIPSRTGVPTQSQVLRVTPTLLNGQSWIDGMHLGSEIPNYYTRYMATVKEHLGIVVTFSAHKNFYSKYANDFLNAIKSLRVLVTKDTLAQSGIGGINGQIGGNSNIRSKEMRLRAGSRRTRWQGKNVSLGSWRLTCGCWPLYLR